MKVINYIRNKIAELTRYKFIKRIKSKIRKNLDSGELSLTALVISLFIGLIISFCTFFIMYQYFTPENQKQDLQPYIIITAGFATIYLWIVNQRKKEREYHLNKLKIEQDYEGYHEKNKLEIQRNLNSRYVEAVEQFSSPKTFLAGAYALRSLIDDWYLLDIDKKPKNIQMQQIALILFNTNRDKILENDIKRLYFNLLQDTFKNSLHLQNNEYIYSLNLFNISELVFQNINFSKLNLDYINLNKSSFIETKFNETKLNGAVLNRAKFNRAELNGASLIRAELNGANLNGAELNGANLNGAELIKANLNGASLTGASLNEAELNGAELNGASINEAELNGASIIEANLNEANLNEASLNGAMLNKAKLYRAKLYRAKLNKTNLDEAELNGAELNEAKLNRAELNWTDFSYTKLNRAELSGAKLNGANLNGAELNEAKLNRAELNWASLNGAELNGASLIGANLNGAELNGASLIGATIKMTKYYNTIITRFSLNSLNFKHPKLIKNKYENISKFKYVKNKIINNN